MRIIDWADPQAVGSAGSHGAEILAVGREPLAM